MDRLDDLDQSVLLRKAFPSYGPDWEAAIDFGIDVSLLVGNLDLTPTERFRQLQRSQALVRAFRPGGQEEVLTVEDELFRRLVAAEVEFVVIGGVAAVAYGSAYTTTDLDITAPFTVENLRRLMTSLEGTHPRWMTPGDKRPVEATPEQLASYKNLYFLTDLGRLDVLGSVPPVGSYEVVASRAEEMTVAGLKVRVIALDDLITIKADVGRPKDQLVEKELRAIRELRAAKK